MIAPATLNGKVVLGLRLRGENQVEFATWNTLHDGAIESITGEVPGDLTFTVSISYLCEKLPTSANFLFLTIRRCTHLVFAPYEGEQITDAPTISGLELEILSAREKNGVVSIACVNGTLSMIYQAIEVKLVEGTPVSQAQLEDAAQRYWTEWSEEHRSGK